MKIYNSLKLVKIINITEVSKNTFSIKRMTVGVYFLKLLLQPGK